MLAGFVNGRAFPVLLGTARTDRAFGLDGRLDRIKSHIAKVFPAPREDDPKATRGIASEPEDDSDKPQRILLKK